jgi:hypothetical protein
MALADDLDFRALAHELISGAGRTVTFGRISKRAADPEKPWKGSGSTEDLEDTFTCDIAQLPDMTLGLIGGSGFGAMGKTDDLFMMSELIVLVAQPVFDPNKTFALANIMIDTDGSRWRIHARKSLVPGNTAIVYALGLVR